MCYIGNDVDDGIVNPITDNKGNSNIINLISKLQILEAEKGAIIY